MLRQGAYPACAQAHKHRRIVRTMEWHPHPSLSLSIEAPNGKQLPRYQNQWWATPPFWIAATSKLHKCGSGGSIDADPDTQLHSRLEGGRCLLIERLRGGGGENGLPGRWVGRGGSAVRCGHGWPWRWTSEEHHLARNVPPTWRPTKCHAVSHCPRVGPQRLRPEPTTLRHSRGQRAEGGTP